MITAQWIQTLATMAGIDFQWGRKFSRPKSDVRTGLRHFLWNYADGKCVFCANPIGTIEAMEMCHIVSAGDGRRGYLPGNIAAGCTRCNQTHAFLELDVIPISEILLPESVPMEWPSTVELRNDGRAIQAMQGLNGANNSRPLDYSDSPGNRRMETEHERTERERWQIAL